MASAITRHETGGGLPVLWHLKASNYNEKARWALDHKRIPHFRRAVTPGRHQALARKLSGGSTLPVLVIDGRAVGDSTRIISELERRYPEHRLYPQEPSARRRALELEELFDEQLGPYARLLFLHHALPDAGLIADAFMPGLRGARRTLARTSVRMTRGGIRSRFGIDAGSVRRAYDKLAAAGERFRAELQPSGYLVGASFTVADLTLAALIAPLVAPPEFPYAQPQRRHPLLARPREALASEGLLYWSMDMYARHRGASAEVRRSVPG